MLFMIPGLVAIWVPLFMSTPRYGPHMRGGLSVSSESNSASALHPLASRAGRVAAGGGGFEEERRRVRFSRGFEGHFILPQVSVSVTNSSVSGELTSRELACRRQRIDVAAGGAQRENERCSGSSSST